MMYMNRGETKNERTGGSHGIQDHGKNGKYEEPYGGSCCSKETAGPSEEAIMACAKADLEFEIATMFWEIV